jgi:hypothetical protein
VIDIFSALPSDWRLVRVGRNKAPLAGDGWFDIDDFTPDEAAGLNGSSPPAWGLKCGPASGVVVLDLDAKGWRESFQQVTGHPIKDLPPTIGWSSGKPGRSAHAFQVDREWWPHLANRHSWKNAAGKVCWELRWDRHQSVIIGAHPETAGYSWLPSRSPSDIPEPAMAPDWLLEALLVQELPQAQPVQVTAEDASRAVAMLACLPPDQFCGYSDWLRVGMALHHTDPGLLTEWVNWSRQMPSFDEPEILQKWASFDKPYRGRPATIATLHHLAKQHGYREPKRQPAGAANHAAPEPSSDLDQLLGTAEEGKLRRPRTDKLTQAVALVLPLRYNLLTNRIERAGEAIHGDYLGGLYLELAENHGLELAKDRGVDAAIRVARQNAYHPVRDYLNGITDQLTPEEWASLDLHCFGGEDPSGWGVIHLQRQLIGLVARGVNPGCELHTCVVLQSDQQGIGKSTFWKILGGPWFSDSLGDLRDVREDRLQLHSAWIHEWGEIDNVMGKRESETLKRFISSSRDDVRRPYGRGTEQLLRSCGLVGTTNRRDFIKDPTGNRRFPIIQIRKVQLDWVKANRDRIWGSAVAAYRAGQQWHYDTTENATISRAAQDYAAEDPLRDQIETWMDDHPGITAIAMPVIVFHLNRERQRDQEFARQVALRLTALGWSKSQQRERGYLPNGDRHDKATIWVAPAPTSGPPS